MIFGEEEMKDALNAGWDKLDIVKPSVRQMEGRRYSDILITWAALRTMLQQNNTILERIYSDQVMQKTTVRIGDVEAPPKEEA